MTTEIFFSSNKLGEVTNEQLQLMLNRFNLGKLISSERTAKGVGKQTMFVKSSSGEYVLKGNPLFEGQFIEEKFYVDNLLRRTKLPVPSPYLTDESKDIFGWSYSIMSRLPGRHINEPEFEAKLSGEDKIQIAELLAKSLSELHTWKADQYGEFDPKNQTLRPFEGSYKLWLYNRIRFWLEDAKKYSVITYRDIEWVENILALSEDVFDVLCSPTFVMGDVKADNGEERLAKQFITAYFNASEAKEAFLERFRVHMLHQRVLDWGCARAINNVTWDKDLSFSQWAQRYTESAAYLLC